MRKILVVDDDKDMRLLLTRFLTKHGFETFNADSGAVALKVVTETHPNLVLCDFRLDDMNGAELLRKIKEIDPHTQVIIITGYSDVKDAVEVTKLGAFDYVTKPLFPDEILLTISEALNDVSDTDAGDKKLTGQDRSKHNDSGEGFLAGNSAQFQSILRQVSLVAPTNFSVIIYGESGCGKEVISKQIHLQSKRSSKPFIAIDCGALSKELAGSELFGHEKGAFTGATNRKIGSLELANGGTIFLDEIGNLSYDIQVSLLRVVQERKIRRIGGTTDIDIDVRIIIASNERLWDMARAGKFREDLYHRFNEFSIEVPPLRERKEDIMTFAHYFLRQTNAELGKSIKGFSAEVEQALRSYIWYGNLRELKNVVKRATLLTDGDIVDVRSLPFEISNFYKLQFENDENIKGAEQIDQHHQSDDIANMLKNKLKAANLGTEYEVILKALKQSDYNKSKAAKLLNIDRKTLYNKMRQFKEFNL
ncbi:MAG: sigma-54-dependent Fis family transcriptional regulator [Chitinophagaceae bacterium]|nr:sigma-54-dependent Fis family transcriptional regulator [Chitinophagaceae bacterium]